MSGRGQSGRSTLIAVAHGSRDPAAAEVIEALLRRVAGLRPGLVVRPAYLEAASPLLVDALAATPGPVVVLPLLLAPGYHVTVDIPAVVAAAVPLPAAAGGASTTGDLGLADRVRVGRVLGPDPLLAEALADRLDEVGWHAEPEDAVVLAAAGSNDPVAIEAVAVQADLLGAYLGVPVTVGYGSARYPTVPEAVAAARVAGAGRVAVASYLLAPGSFQRRLAGVGADLVTGPLGDHPSVARLLLVRYGELS